VQSDGQADRLTGGTEADWFWFGGIAPLVVVPPPPVRDVITDWSGPLLVSFGRGVGAE
jgi:Ca2+-binding RTX toxin-like protein